MRLANADLSRQEQSLFDRVEREGDVYSLANLTADELCAISQGKGIDFATALLYRSLREASDHVDFIRRVEAYDESSDQPFDFSARIVIVPGAFYREFPEFGADGRLLQQTARELGITVEVIPLESFGSLQTNAAFIVDWLRRNRGEPIVLVSLSKGSADLKTAFASAAPELFESVSAWVSLSGIVFGSPIVRWLQASRLRAWWYWLLLSVRGYDFRNVGEMDHGTDTPLAAELQIPAHVSVIHIVGFPLECHLTSSLARRMYRRLQPLGPNDGGGTLLTDALRLQGVVYPVWGADHYLRPAHRDMRQLMRAILRTLCDRRSVIDVPAATIGAQG